MDLTINLLNEELMIRNLKLNRTSNEDVLEELVEYSLFDTWLNDNESKVKPW